MDRTAAVTHAAHDELLIARFYGGDVDESERVRVLDRMADCRDCAALFADLAAIAEADEAMPVPPRPRDFTLTEEDAVRLRPKRRALSGIFGPGLHRSLGGSLAALGLVGMVLTGGRVALRGRQPRLRTCSRVAGARGRTEHARQRQSGLRRRWHADGGSGRHGSPSLGSRCYTRPRLGCTGELREHGPAGIARWRHVCRPARGV